jgi:hypothetical protein
MMIADLVVNQMYLCLSPCNTGIVWVQIFFSHIFADIDVGPSSHSSPAILPNYNDNDYDKNALIVRTFLSS